jgi:hypothetical protein
MSLFFAPILEAKMELCPMGSLPVIAPQPGKPLIGVATANSTASAFAEPGSSGGVHVSRRRRKAC